MFYAQRDATIDYVEEHGVYCSGGGLGVLLVDEIYPAFPGDVRNPSAFPYPIQYEVVENMDIQALVRSENKEKYLDTIIKTARKLEKLGCKALIGECGYFAYFQKEVADAVKIPAFMSSLLQIRWAQSVIGSNQVVGVLMSGKAELLEKHLTNIGVEIDSNYVIGGAMDGNHCQQFHLLWDRRFREGPARASYQDAERDFVKCAVDFYNENPNMGAMVLECTGFPPFAKAIQQRIGIPIFSWATLMDYAYLVTCNRDFYGRV